MAVVLPKKGTDKKNDATTKPASSKAGSGETKLIQMKVDAEFHQSIKILAAERNMTIKSVIIDLLEKERRK